MRSFANTTNAACWSGFSSCPLARAGAWINWNNLGFCSTLWDSDKSGQPIVKQTLGAGSHRIEWAYREGGAILMDNIILLQDYPNQGEQCSD